MRGRVGASPIRPLMFVCSRFCLEVIFSMRRLSALFLCLVFCLSLFPRYAFAAANDEVPTVIWSGYLDGGYYGVLATAENRYDAAVVALGYNPALLSSEVKSKLSDVNHGGNFYKYATTFDEVSSVAEYPEWVPAYVSIGNIISDYWHFGTGFPPWKSRATNTLYTNALIDLKLILAGEDLGGGGSTVVPGSYELVSFQSFNWRLTSGATQNKSFKSVAREATYHDGEVTLGSGTMTFSPWGSSTYYVSGCRGYVSSSVLEVVSSYVSQGYDVVFCLDGMSYDGSYFQEYAGFVYLGHDLSFSETSPSGNDRLTALNGTDMSRIRFSNTGMYYDSLGIFMFVSGSAGSVEQLSGYQYLPFFSSPIYGSTNPPPSGDWPEPSTPVTPTAPELPEPATPTVETPVSPTVPAPVWPDINITVQPAPTDTTPNDYTPWLQAILSSLNSLRSELLSEFDGLVQSLRNIFSYLLTLDSVLETHCVHIRNKIEESAVFLANYMRTLVKWLAEQLDFDSTVNVEAPDLSMLSTINDKLGGGTYEPNPIKDEQGYYQWLDDLWDRFLLGDNWQSSMGSISGSFNELKTRFPFSIPWDVVALFRLFVHDPVTPVFDLPLYFSSDGSTPVHVDLTPWDSVAAVVRPLVFVIFALKLALLSRDLLGGLGADKGGL